MRRGGALAFLLGLIAACASTPEPGGGEDPAPEKLVPVTEIAKKYLLTTEYEEDRRRLRLTGPAARVTLFPRTTVMLVNGRRVPGTGRVVWSEGRWCVSEADAERIHLAVRDRRPSPVRREPVGTPPPASSAKPKKMAGPVPGAEPGWQAPLTRKWRYLVIHHSATASGNAASFGRHHIRARGWDGLGYHFVIGNGRGSKDGQVEVGYRWTRQLTGAHAGRGRGGSNLMNETGIGIALVGDFNRSRPTPNQIASLGRLVAFLRRYCRIPATGVLLHRDVKKTACPGRSFPSSRFVVPMRVVPAAFR